MRPMLETIPSVLVLEPLIANTLRATALIGIAALATLALRRAPAALRHLVWTLALLGCVAMPLASRVTPGWSLPAMPWAVSATVSPASDAGTSTTMPTSPAPSGLDRAPEPASVTAAPGPAAAPAAPAAWRLRGADVLRALPVLWLAGVALMMVRGLFASFALSRLARKATPVTDPAWERALRRHAAALGLEGLPAIRTSAALTVPLVCGTLRPAILLPVEALEFGDDRRDAVLLHELAHVRRLDLLTARATQLATVLYWFNPLVWLAARAQRAEAERACDDQVLRAGARASAYASDLLEIARSVGRERLDAAALAMARRSQLEGRLLAILDPRQPRGTAGRVAVSLVVVAGVASLGALAAARPAQSPASVVALPTGGSVVSMEHLNQPTVQAAAPATAASGTRVPLTAKPATDVSDRMMAAGPNDGMLTAAPTEGLLAAGSSHWSISNTGKGELRSGSWNNKDSRGSYKSKGTVRYSVALNDIESISPGGYVEIEDRHDGKVYRAVFKARSGGIEKSFSVDDVDRPWDDGARAWFADFLINLDRSSGTLAEQRFPRLMSEGGPTRVLGEISQMTSDYGRSIYFRKLFATELQGPAMNTALLQAGREISSDYELARTLVTASEHSALSDPATAAAYLEALKTMESDYEHARVLMEVVKSRALAPSLVESVINSTSTMQSDYERARVMAALAENGHVKPALQRAFLKGTHAFQSDYERSRVLRAFLERGELTSENVGPMLVASAAFQSDYERANVLVALAESVPLDRAGRAAFVEATNGFSSDYDKGRALAALGKASAK